MTQQNRVRFVLPDGLRQSAEAGQHNFFMLVAEVLTEAGFLVEYGAGADGLADGYSIFHMEPPLSDRSLTVRRNLYYPFWQIERSEKRWQWDVARDDFDSQAVDARAATKFYRFWQTRLFGEAAKNPTQNGIVYVPLQGRLTQHRSFQTCAPLTMLEHVAAHAPDRRIVATLHPKETYSEAELSALEALATRLPRLEIALGDMEQWLQACAYVVTQNSSAAFAGLFFGKPSILFARIDFHHVMANVDALGVEGAFRAIDGLAPDYAGYVWWFLQQRSINAGRPEAKQIIRARLLHHGWPV